MDKNTCLKKSIASFPDFKKLTLKTLWELELMAVSPKIR